MTPFIYLHFRKCCIFIKVFRLFYNELLQIIWYLLRMTSIVMKMTYHLRKMFIY